MLEKVLKFKGLFIMAVVYCIIFTGGISVNAKIVSEKEPNDSMSSAELIEANRETAEDAISGSRPNQYVVEGFTDLNDNDWFKVYLTSGTQYVTCNDEDFYFEIYDPYKMHFMSQTYTKTGFGYKPYPISVPYSGEYYIKVTGLKSSPTSYILAVGGPTYSVANCEVKLKNVVMSGSNVTIPFEFGWETVLPEESAVYSVLAKGIQSTSVKSVSLKNLNTATTINLNSYSWDKNGLVSLKMPINSKWQMTFFYKKNITLTPSIKLFYVYPVTSRLYSDIVISR